MHIFKLSGKSFIAPNYERMKALTSTETYSEIGTTVFATITYEKNTSKPIIVGPRTGSFGIIFSHGKKTF